MRSLALLLLLALTLAAQAASITIDVAPTSMLCTFDWRVQHVYLLTIPAGQTTRFVTEAYQLLLQRDPDPGGLAHYTAAIDGGTMTHEQFLATLEGSAEFKELHP